MLPRFSTRIIVGGWCLSEFYRIHEHTVLNFANTGALGVINSRSCLYTGGCCKANKCYVILHLMVSGFKTARLFFFRWGRSNMKALEELSGQARMVGFQAGISNPETPILIRSL